ALTVADASELMTSLQSENGQGSPPQKSQPTSAVRDRKAVKDADWADYVRQTQAALEILARETQGVALVPAQPRPQPALQPQAQPGPQPQPAPRSQAQPRPEPPQPPVPPQPGA